MKRMQLAFPLMFLLAFAGSAFSLHAKWAESGVTNAYYYNPNWNTCNEIQLFDDKCFPDNLAYPCMEFIGGLGSQQMWQDGFGNTCYQPFYQYTP